MMVYFEIVRESVEKLCQIRAFKDSYIQNTGKSVLYINTIYINQLEDKTSLGITIKMIKYLQIQQHTHEENFKTLLKNTEE